jgi:hypothetical protein
LAIFYKAKLISIMTIKNLLFYTILIVLVSGCSKNNDPQKEDVPELITQVTLTFTPTAGGAPIVGNATDPDGEGVQDIKTDGNIVLNANTTYVLSIQLLNGLAKPTDEAYDVTKEVRTEGQEHQFYFSWDNGTFTNTKVNYTGGSDSIDENGLPLGLSTTWTTADAKVSGSTFHVTLKHQPGLKSSTSTINDGETDLDVLFKIDLQ